VADTYTGAAASSLDQTAYDLAIYFALRPELYFDPVATVRATNQAMPGSSVVFTIEADLAAATTALAESTDVSAVAMSDSQVTVTLVEQGNAVITTALLRGTSFIPFDPIVANVVGYNAGLSLDTIARNVLFAGSNVYYADATGGITTAGRTGLAPTMLFTSKHARRAVAQLRGASVRPINGYYIGYIHPDVSYDFRNETGTSTWTDPHAYSSPDGIFQGEIGAFAGIRFVETPRATVVADAGSSTTLTDVYETVIIGQEALAKAYSSTDGNGPLPAMVAGPITDHLRRLQPFGWYWLGGYARFREAAIRRYEGASSIGV
jgi:N4-gp56 family major capsid protein